MSGIFISYRRRDTAYIAGRLHDQLAPRFGPDRIFRDIDTMAPGVDFVKRVDDAVGSCDALVAVIGDNWLTTMDAQGRRRIDNPRDWVRVEIAAALKRKILVVPVLVEDAAMPTPEQLPPALRTLARYHALELTDARWDYDVGKLIGALESAVPAPGLRLRSRDEPYIPRERPRSPEPSPLKRRPRPQAEADRAPRPLPAVSQAPDRAPAASVERAPAPPPAGPPPSGPRPSGPSSFTPPPAIEWLSVPPWVKFAAPAAVAALLATVLAVVLLAPNDEPAPEAGNGGRPATSTPTTLPDPERPYAFAALPGGPISIGGKSVPTAEVDGVSAATAVPIVQVLQYGGPLDLSPRARNQLQFVVNRLGPPSKGAVDVVAVGGAWWAEDPSKPPAERRALRVGALIRNGYTRSATDPRFESRLFCRDRPEAGSPEEKLVAGSRFELLTSAGFPITPPSGSLYVELQYAPAEVSDPEFDAQRYKFCRFDPARLTG